MVGEGVCSLISLKAGRRGLKEKSFRLGVNELGGVGFEGSTSTNLPGLTSTVKGLSGKSALQQKPAMVLDILVTSGPATVPSVSSSSLMISIFFVFLDSLGGNILILVSEGTGNGGEECKLPDDELEMLTTDVAVFVFDG